MIKQFSIDDTVVVCNPCLKSNGCVGTIQYLVGTKSALVKFNDKFDTLHIKLSNLKHWHDVKNNIKKEKNFMIVNSNINSDENFKIVMIRFLEGKNVDKLYPYACFNDDINVDDYVVVKSAHNGLGIAQVKTEVDNPTEEYLSFICQGREIIDKFDIGFYKTRLVYRKQRIEDNKRKNELRKQMRELASADNELMMFEKMAENNPQMAKLFREYTKLI